MNERLTTQTKSYCILCTTIRNAPLRRLCRSRRNPSRKKKESTHQRVWLNGTITDTTRSSFSSSVLLPQAHHSNPPYVPSRCDRNSQGVSVSCPRSRAFLQFIIDRHCYPRNWSSCSIIQEMVSGRTSTCLISLP
jgi:hypothetical protein